ncbi:MAG: rod shape-determining protein MreC [Myxococcota bacterium]
MWDLLQRYRGLALVGALLVAPLILLYAQTRNPATRGPVVGIVIDGSSLIEEALLWAAGGVSDWLQRYTISVEEHDELLRLRRERVSAAALKVRVSELERENESIRSLALLAQRVDGPRPLGARVIGRSGAPLTRLLRIDRGADDGVARGDGVISVDGVVGRVLVVGRHSSDVLLLTDPSAAVDVIVQRTRARGVLRGTGQTSAYRARVEDFDRLADVAAGDVLVTSGLGRKFPPGLPVGEVDEVALREDGLYQLATARPSVQMHELEHVLVLLRRPPPRLPLLAGSEESLAAEEPPADLQAAAREESTSSPVVTTPIIVTPQPRPSAPSPATENAPPAPSPPASASEEAVASSPPPLTSPNLQAAGGDATESSTGVPPVLREEPRATVEPSSTGAPGEASP